MTDKPALDLYRLIAAIEAGTVEELQFFTWRPGLTGTRKESYTMVKAYRGSLDAALALHEALLPGWGYAVGFDQYSAMVRSTARVSHMGCEERAMVDDPFVPRPARALLLATLRAYRSRL